MGNRGINNFFETTKTCKSDRKIGGAEEDDAKALGGGSAIHRRAQRQRRHLHPVAPHAAEAQDVVAGHLGRALREGRR